MGEKSLWRWLLVHYFWSFGSFEPSIWESVQNGKVNWGMPVFPSASTVSEFPPSLNSGANGVLPYHSRRVQHHLQPSQLHPHESMKPRITNASIDTSSYPPTKYTYPHPFFSSTLPSSFPYTIHPLIYFLVSFSLLGPAGSSEMLFFNEEFTQSNASTNTHSHI